MYSATRNAFPEKCDREVMGFLLTYGTLKALYSHLMLHLTSRTRVVGTVPISSASHSCHTTHPPPTLLPPTLCVSPALLLPSQLTQSLSTSPICGRKYLRSWIPVEAPSPVPSRETDLSSTISSPIPKLPAACL